MTLVEHIRAHNDRYQASFEHGDLAGSPARGWAILACMDARITVEGAAGLATGDAHIIRNAGGIVTEDAVRSFVISTHLLGTREFAIIEHTGCGMLTFEEEPVRTLIAEKTGADTSELRLSPFRDLEENLEAQVAALAASPFLPPGIPVTGFVYEVETGRLREIAHATTGESGARPGPDRRK